MRALISVYNKSDLLPLAKQLIELGWELVSTGGTARLLQEENIPVTAVSSITNAPEMLGGRVKTLHPAIHGGILARNTPEHQADLTANNISYIDLVICNLYPFSETIAQPNTTLEEAIEQIDIGGVTLLRAAAKNFARVTILSDPADYTPILTQLKDSGTVDLATRRRLALKAFTHTRDYDSAISTYLSDDASLLPQNYTLNLYQTAELRYGENPHQQAALYATNPTATPFAGTQLQGKPLSYNNLLDLDAAWRTACSFSEPAVVIVKHLSPCGVAINQSIAEAFPDALASDPISAFGGVIAVNQHLDESFIAQLEAAKLFVEAIAAPSFSPEAISWFAKKKKNCRLLSIPNTTPTPRLELRSILNGYLIQDLDLGDPSETEWTVVTERQPTAAEWAAARFGWTVVQHVKSNGVLFTTPTTTVGIGGGLPSRVDAVQLAATKAGEKAKNCILASDAFFPFADGIESAAAAGATGIIQPGGSIRDEETIAAANRLNLTMIFTHTRHFRH